MRQFTCPTVESVIEMFNAAQSTAERERAKRAGARLPIPEQLLVVDAAIASYWRLRGGRPNTASTVEPVIETAVPSASTERADVAVCP